MKVHLLPIEPFEERYTAQWIRWWPRELERAGLEVNVINGNTDLGERAGGEFLDPFKTWRWKGSQLERLAEAFQSGAICSGDVVLSLDGWGPATTGTAYMRDAGEGGVGLAIYLHAGSYDKWDFLARCGMERWAGDVECGWLEAADVIFVATQFHKQLLIDKRYADPDKVIVVGQPIYASELHQIAPLVPFSERPPLVVFPHRFAHEKAPEDFDRIEYLYNSDPARPKAIWVKTRDPKWAGTEFDGYSSKAKYYELLSRARVVVSTAWQETFGIAMQEGIAMGAWAVAPRRLCYPEVIRNGQGILYQSYAEAVTAIEDYLQRDRSPAWDSVHEGAIGRVAETLKGRFA